MPESCLTSLLTGTNISRQHLPARVLGSQQRLKVPSQIDDACAFSPEQPAPTEMQLHQEPAFAATPRATPTYGEGGWATAIFSTTIAAPPATCLEVVLDPAGYGGWNRWIPRVGVDTPAPASAATAVPPELAPVVAAKTELLLPGARFHFEVHMDPESAASRRTDLEVTLLGAFESSDGRRGLRVAWKTQGDPVSPQVSCPLFLALATGTGKMWPPRAPTPPGRKRHY